MKNLQLESNSYKLECLHHKDSEERNLNFEEEDKNDSKNSAIFNSSNFLKESNIATKKLDQNYNGGGDSKSNFIKFEVKLI